MRAPEVKALVDVLTVKLSESLDKLARVDTKQDVTAQVLNDYRREQDTKFAVLKQRVDDMHSSREKWAMRAWGLVGPVVTMLLGYSLGMRK